LAEAHNSLALLDQILVDNKSLTILRGDKIAGGLKKLALLRYLPLLNHHNFAYAGTVFGSGGWAVAHACADLKLDCTLYLSKSTYSPPWLDDVTQTGATINWQDPLPVADIHQTITTQYPHLYNLPLGFDDEKFIVNMASVLAEICPTPSPEIWLPALSGTLARSASMAFPSSIIHAVSAVKHHGDCGRAIIHDAPDKFYHMAKLPPPYPSCPFSCGKVWSVAKELASPKAMIINVSS
jgi:hypothetical protein